MMDHIHATMDQSDDPAGWIDRGGRLFFDAELGGLELSSGSLAWNKNRLFSYPKHGIRGGGSMGVGTDRIKAQESGEDSESRTS